MNMLIVQYVSKYHGISIVIYSEVLCWIIRFFIYILASKFIQHSYVAQFNNVHQYESIAQSYFEYWNTSIRSELNCSYDSECVFRGLWGCVCRCCVWCSGMSFRLWRVNYTPSDSLFVFDRATYSIWPQQYKSLFLWYLMSGF